MSYIGKQPVPQSLQSRQQFTGDGSTTDFATIGGVELYEDVFLNGVRLSRVDNEYSFDGTTLTITPAPANGDTVSIILRNDHSELIALPITDSQGNNVLSESGSVVTLTADNVGIGTTSPATNLDTQGFQLRSDQFWYNGGQLRFVDKTSGTAERMRIDSSGNVGIGTSSPGNKLHVEKDGSTVATFRTSNNNSSGGIELCGKNSSGTIQPFYIQSGASSELILSQGISATERMRIDSSGNVLIGSNLRLTHVGGYPALVGNSGTGGIAINVNQPGIVPATASGEQHNVQDLGRSGIRWNDAYVTNGVTSGSDANEKTDITTSELGLDFIKGVNPVSFKWAGRYRTHYGMISQEIETLLSDVGKTSMDFAGLIKSPVIDNDGNETGEYNYGLRYHEFISPMIKAIQEQQTLIESQQSQIDALTARIEALEATS